MNNHICLYIRLTCISLVIITARSDFVFAQGLTDLSESSKDTYWLNAGLGFSTLGSLSGNLGGSFQHDNLLFSLRTTVHSESTFEGGDEFFDLGFLVGFASRSTTHHASIAIGIARVTGSRYEGKSGLFSSGKRVEIDAVIGIPIETQLFIKFNNAGIGVNIFVNLNKVQTFGGLNFNFQL